jgi:hypothetical protein
MLWNENFFIICLTMCALALFAAITFSYHTESNLMARNIETAIEKGIDPLSVRCSYAKQNDTICIVFAANESKSVIQSK